MITAPNPSPTSVNVAVTAYATVVDQSVTATIATVASHSTPSPQTRKPSGLTRRARGQR
jgi:hypothetical protein